jgi:hypothetical protein
MTDRSQGPGWWIASDGKWYPPHLHPAYSSVPSTGEPTRWPASDGWQHPAERHTDHELVTPKAASDVSPLANDAGLTMPRGQTTGWRETPTGARQWLGADGNWYSSEQLAKQAGVQRPPPHTPQTPARTVSGAAPRNVSPSVRTPHKSKAHKKTRGWLVAAGIAVIGILFVAEHSGGANPRPSSGAHASYRASIVSVSHPTDPTDPLAPTTPKTITVAFRVTNDGSIGGKPSCGIMAQAPTGAHGGTRVTDTSSLPVSHSVMSTVSLRITRTRAGRITKTEVKISCT